MEQNLNKTLWREAATGGLYLGLVYAALSLAAHFGKSVSGVASLCNALCFFAIAGFLYFYARRAAALSGSEGFSFGRCYLLMLRISLFAGVLAGLGQFVLINWLDPQGFQDQMDLTVATLAENGMSEREVRAAGKLTMSMMKNPIVVVLGGIFGMVIYGGLIGLIVSFFAKRPADPFAADRDSSESL